MNPKCPEKSCKRMLRVKTLSIELGFSMCPSCGSSEHKPYIMTKGKEGLHKCSNCRTDFKPKIRQGLAKFFVCPDHPHQNFKVGAETIISKSEPKMTEELKKLEDTVIMSSNNRPKRTGMIRQ